MSSKKLPTGNRTNITVLASAISTILGTGGIQAVQAQEQAAAGPQEVVIITGSRIVRRDLTAASPIMTVDAERLDLSSTISVETVLNQMTQFIPAQTQFNAQGQIQTDPTTSLGIGTVNLRGVSTNRTLVLLDGRRAQPANASLVVDLNTIPSAAIARIETITGGASAVYGADALAGVVNFVLRDDFEGISLDLQTGFTDAGDGEETRFSSLIGMNSDSGNANIILGVEWYEREASFQKNRDFYTKGWYDQTNQLSTFFASMPNWDLRFGGTPPRQDVVDDVFEDAYGTPRGTVNNQQQFFFNLDGTPFVRQNGSTIGFDASQLNRPYIGDGFYGLVPRGSGVEQVFVDGPLSTPLERRSAFAKGHVDINDNMRAFVQANFSRTEVETFSAGPPPAYFGWAGTIPNDGRAVPAALQTLLNGRDDPNTPEDEGAAPWTMARGLDFLGHFGPTNTSDVYQIMAGVEGDFDNRDWTWEAYFSTGQTNTTNLYVGMPSIQRWHALVESPNWGAGQTISNGTYEINCTSGLPIFEGTTATTTQDCIQGILGGWKSLTVLKQEILEANLQGKIIDMGSGELRFAAGVSSRENSYKYEPANPQSAIFDQPLGIFVSNPADGKTKVDEIYGELLIPVLDRLNFEVGYRYSDYDNAAGQVGTYKALVDIAATDSMRIRGGYQRANRAPNSAELFQSSVTVFSTGFVGDPCQINTNATWGNVPGNPNRAGVQQVCGQLINNSAIFGAPGSDSANNFLLDAPGTPPFTGINGLEGGNPNVKSEEADTYTLGVVFQGPGGLDGLTASIDYYSIEVDGAIGTFSGNTIYEQCFNANGMSNPGYTINDPGGFCSLINRAEGTGGTGTVSLTYLNTGFIETSGVDMAVNWAKDISTGGTFYINSQMTFIEKYDTQEKPGDPVREWKDTLGQGGQFKYRLNTTVGYNLAGGRANLGIRMRHLPSIQSASVVTDPNNVIFPTKSYTNFDLFAGYTINDRYQFRGGIDNLFEEDPAIVGARPGDSNSNSTLAGYYDTLGRRMYIGLKMVF